MRNLLIVALTAVVILTLFNNSQKRHRIRQLKEQMSLIKAQDRQDMSGVNKLEEMLTSYSKRMDLLEARANECRGVLDMPPGLLPLPLYDPPVRDDNS